MTHSRTNRINKWVWLEEYACGCTDYTDRKSDLLGYCGKHGDDRINLYRILREYKDRHISFSLPS